MIGQAHGHTFVKICGITRLDDARVAVRAGANAVGFVFAKSPRRITPGGARRIAERLHPAVQRIGVFVDSSVERVLEVVDQVGLDGVQLQGTEPPEMLEEVRNARPNLFVARVVRADRRQSIEDVTEPRADVIFLDSRDVDRPSAKSRRIPMAWLRSIPAGRVVLAGGLTPANVGAVVRGVRPWGVDVSSGVETSPGKKDPAKIRAFIQAVRRAEAAPDPHSAGPR